jgi:GT2 family glycosyltransferase
VVVSVVIVNWNGKAFLEQCLRSLAEDVSRHPMEILVVDNASTDGSPQMVAENFPHVRLARNEANFGFAKGNNIGIRLSTGDYVCLVNSDVKVLTDCFTKLVDFMDEHPEVGMAGPKMIGADGKVGRSCRGFPNLWNMFCHAIGLDSMFPKARLFGGYALSYWSQDTSRPVDILGGWFWIVRRKAFEEVGLLDEDFFLYAEDMDWCRRFHLKHWGLYFLASAESVHFGGGSSRHAPVKHYIQEQRADLRYWRKHYSRFEQGVYYCICILHQAVRLVGHGLLRAVPPGKEEHAYKAQRSWETMLWFLKGAK